MSDTLLLYGATGYTARLIIEEALRAGLTPVLAARDARRVARLAERYGLDACSARLEDKTALAGMLRGRALLLNAAGPFADTAAPLVEACLRAGVHYLDISGEVSPLLAASRRHAAARARGVMLLPAVGFDVVPSDCLCLGLLRARPDTTTLRIGVSGLSLVSPGSARTLSRQLGAATLIRRRGRLTAITPGSVNHHFVVEDAVRPFTAVSWGDLVTAHHSTGIDNIETYFELTPAVLATIGAQRYFGALFGLPQARAVLEREAARFATEPGRRERASRRARIVVEGQTASGKRYALEAITPEAYTLTARTSVAIAKRVLRGDIEPGFQTPARLYGADFIWQFEGVTRVHPEPVHVS